MIEYRLLGPVEVVWEDGPVPLGAPKQRALFALLLLNANRVVSREQLVDQLWPTDPPETAVKGVQVYVSQLRKLLPPGTLVTRSPGYLLAAEPEAIDLQRFERLVEQAREVGPERATEFLRQALALWRGPPLAEFSEPFAQIEAGRLDELRLATIEQRLEADLALGRHAEVIGELETLIADHPQRERLRANLMVALYRSGRQTEALAAYQDARAALDDVGLEPSEQLRRVESQILTQDPALAPTRRKTNLPAAATLLIGRTRELADVIELVRAHRLVTLTGAGGSGKTRLALAAAKELGNDFGDGVWFVSLESISDPELVESTIAQVVGARGDLNEFLRGKRVLLLLDNLEQLLPEVASRVALLEAVVLATSRERLKVSGEREYLVPTLALDDSAALFTRQARELEPRFQPDEHVPEIVRKLDGLPLAIELAAARVKTLTPRQIVERLGHSLDLLTGGARDKPGRQQTLRTTLEWSYQLLDGEEQSLFARLGVFAGGCTIEAAEQVADAQLDVVQSLVEKSLLRFEEERFRMLTTVRELALEKLELEQDAERVRRRHAQYLLDSLAEARPDEMGSLDSDLKGRRDAEADNVRVAMEWAIRMRHANLALGLAWLWVVRIPPRERAHWLDASLVLGEDADPAILARALAAAAGTHNALGDCDLAMRLAERSVDLFATVGDHSGEAHARRILGIVALARGELSRARAQLERSRQLAEESRSTVESNLALIWLGKVELAAGDVDRAGALFEAALSDPLTAKDTISAHNVEIGLGDTALARGDLAVAEQHYRLALQDARNVDMPWLVAASLAGLASVAARSSEPERAGRLWGAWKRFEQDGGVDLLAHETKLYNDALATVAGPQFDAAANAIRGAEPDEALAAALADETSASN